MNDHVRQATLANAEFWDEPCGTTRLAHLGFEPNQRDAASFTAFDKWFFDFYPYLERYIPFKSVNGLDVLEVGLGFGSVSERLARSGARLTSFDVAAGPLATLNRRLSIAGKSATLKQGSILEPPFADESFDLVVSIGCLHHTGDLPRAIQQVHRMLRPNGKAVIMLYHSLAFRRWLRSPVHAWRDYQLHRQGLLPRSSDLAARALYDADTKGGTAPETVFTSAAQLRDMAKSFSSVQIGYEHIDTDLLLYPIPHSMRMPFRRAILAAGGALGLANVDMYAVLTK